MHGNGKEQTAHLLKPAPIRRSRSMGRFDVLKGVKKEMRRCTGSRFEILRKLMKRNTTLRRALARFRTVRWRPRHRSIA